jgi:anti-sigma28 factor (negative regulator of flagellin synthesis)
MNRHCTPEDLEAGDLTSKRTQQEETPEQIQEEVRKYVRYLSQVAEPNLARVREIREQIEQGTYLTREIIEETASRLSFRFLRKE